MKKYSDVAADIDSKFKEGITLLNEAVEGIEDLIIAFNSSSGDAIDSLVSDLKAVKEKYTSVIETVKQRSSEIAERANTYDGYINPWIEKMYNGTVTDTREEYVSGVKYRIYTYVTDVQGPDAADGVGYYIARSKRYEIIYTGILGWKKESGKKYKCDKTSSCRVDEMKDFVGGYWGLSDSIIVDTVTAASVTKEKAISNMNEAEADEYIRSNLNPEQWHVYQNSPPGTYSGMTPEEIVANFKGSSVSSLDEYY